MAVSDACFARGAECLARQTKKQTKVAAHQHPRRSPNDVVQLEGGGRGLARESWVMASGDKTYVLDTCTG